MSFLFLLYYEIIISSYKLLYLQLNKIFVGDNLKNNIYFILTK